METETAREDQSGDIEIEEAEIDLNSVFPGEPKDLNRLFPDGRSRRFLKSMKQHQRSVERFLERLCKED